MNKIYLSLFISALCYGQSVNFNEVLNMTLEINDIVEKIKDKAQSENIEWKDEDFEKSKTIIFTQMKALIARDLYDTSAFYRIINDIDDIFSKGLEVITNDKLYYQLIDVGS